MEGVIERGRKREREMERESQIEQERDYSSRINRHRQSIIYGNDLPVYTMTPGLDAQGR